MKAIILAAGVGRRLDGLLEGRPKCLLRFDGEPLLGRLLDGLDALFPDRPMVVSTGRDNDPALTLYRRRGFAVVRHREVIPGLWITELGRRPADGGSARKVVG